MLRLRLVVLATLSALACSLTASAQDVGSGSFAGVVKDASGAVLPGVTVEVASPALIEKVRDTVTDGEGRYRITALRPGTYTVTFTLPGFRTVRRDGIELTTGFVATVDGALTVGAVEETVTVTGAAPVVDVKSSSQQQVFAGEVVDNLPLGKNSGVYVALLPGAVQPLNSIDVGGTKGETQNGSAIHGGRQNDGVTLREGNYDGQMFGSRGTDSISSINPATVQEVNLQLTGGLTAEAQSGGIHTNVVLRDGGNALSGILITDFGHRNLQASNVDDALRARHVTTAAFLDTNYDVAGGVGGPIRKDKLWFFADSRRWKSYSEYPGQYYNKQKGTLFYEPDTTKPGINGTETLSSGLRLTWQATQKNKIAVTGRYEKTCNCFNNLDTGLRAPEATWNAWYYPFRIGQTSWTYPATNRLLVQSSVFVMGAIFTRQGTDATVTPDSISVLDRLRNYRYGASDNYVRSPFLQGNGTASVSYITGSHAVKVGMFHMRAKREETAYINQSVTYTFAGRAPESVTFYAYPNLLKNGIAQSAFYAQDQWSIRDLTLYLGARFDRLRGYAPATHSPTGRYAPARDFPAVNNTVNWKDINPRLGAAYNLFGRNRTALKVNVGRFIGFEPLGGIVAATLPASLIVTSATRTWSDANGDYIPQENELGPLSNANFGRVVSNTTYADDVVHGWGVRSYSWQGSVAVQHELRPGFGVNVGYFRTWYGNFLATDNVLVTPDDYDTYCLTGPGDTRLPGGGGERICGLRAIKPAAFGRVSSLVTHASDYGTQSEVYNGLDFTLNARFRNGALISGGVSTSQTVTDNCEVLDKLPEMSSTPTRFCHVAPPWSAATQLKLFSSYPLPWDVLASVVYQDITGVPTTATYVATNAQVTPVLGRPLAGGANATQSVELIEPNSVFLDGRVRLLSLSLNRTFRSGKTRFQPSLDLHNILNSNSLLQVVQRYGPAWRDVQGVVPPRMIKLSLRVNFQ